MQLYFFTVLIIYDCTLIMWDEIQLIWGRKSTASVLLLLNRLLLIVFAIVQISGVLLDSSLVVRGSSQFTLLAHVLIP